MKEILFFLKQILLIILSIFALNTSSAQISFSQNFGTTSGFPTGWISAGYSNATANACSGRTPRGLLSSAGTNSLTSPEQVNASNGLAINVAFNYKVLDSSGNIGAPINFGSIQVQYSTNGGSTFTTAYTINSSNHVVSNTCAPVSFTIPAGAIPSGSGFQLKFLGTYANGSFYIHLDDVVVNQNTANIPNCNSTLLTPTNGSTNVPISTANLSWSAATGIPTGYRLRVGTTPGGNNIIDNVDVGNVTTYPISLIYSTTYYVGITPYNAVGNATGCTEQSFTTVAPTTTTAPWGEEFLVNSLPTGWTNTGFTIGTHTRLPQSEGNVIFRNLNATNTTGNFSTINVGNIQSGNVLSFIYRLGNFNPAPYNPPAAGSGNFVVSISTDYGITYTNIETVTNDGTAGWQNYSLDLSAYTGQFVKVKITVNRTSGDYLIGFDNFYIGEQITCPIPEDLILNYAGDITAKISWASVANASGYNWYVFSSGANPETASPLLSGTVSTPTVTLTNLAASTDYDFYVEANCGATDGLSLLSEVISFTTQCETIDNFPFTETFETNSLSVDCWTTEYVNGNINWTLATGTPLGSINNAHSGTRNALFYFASYSPRITKLVSPSFDIAQMIEPKLTFWYGNEQGPDLEDQNELRVYYKTSIDAPWTLISGATYTTNVNQWTYIELDLPSVSENYYVAFEGTNYYGEGIVIDDVTISDFYACPTTIWDGIAWSNGTPDLSKKAIIDGGLILSENLEACELEVTTTGSLDIPSGFSFTVNGVITNHTSAENFVVQNGANLIQTSAFTGTNEGAITVFQNSTPMVRNDMTMWSSPVQGQEIKAFSPETLNNRFWNYDEATSLYTVLPNVNVPFEAGSGIAIRVRNTLPTGTSEAMEGKFVGTPFNGTFTVPVTANGQGFNLVGNPYASNIDAQSFLAANSTVNALYFWTHEFAVGSANYGNNYATFSAAGSNLGDVDFISKGQGFFVRTSTAATVEFNNSMRADNSALFYKGQNEIERNRLWISISNQEAKLGQILVAYMSGATNEFDNQIDAKLLENGSVEFYNVLNEGKYAIQGRALPFQDSDIVPLGYKLAEAGTFNINLENFDGLFAEGNLTVYLKDNEKKIIHNLSESAYAFESEAGEFNTRFEIVYQEEEVLGTGDLTANNVQIYTSNNQIVVSSKSEKILSVELFDLAGRNVHTNNKVNANTYQIKSNSKGVLVVKVLTQNGEVVTKRVINK